MKTLTYPDGSTVTYDTYDNGQLKTVTDWEGSQTSYEYDSNGRLTRTSRADGSTETYQYNTAGRLLLQTDKKGEQLLQTISYTYNGYGEISKKVKTYGEGTKEAGKQTEESVTGSGESSKSTEITEEMQYNTANQLTRQSSRIRRLRQYDKRSRQWQHGSLYL